MGKLRDLIVTLVRRPGAEDHLLLSLLAFALSVSLTRLFLWLTGYPQLGGESLHISHVLWGGLFLFAAALLPLIFANQSVYRLTAILAGLGVGLFIDEVGKFITQEYDYFFPLAAPIIYAFFLVCVLVYMQVSKPRSRQARLELYAAFEYLEQVLERDLDPRERHLLAGHLEAAANQGSEPELAYLADVLLEFVRSDQILEVPPSNKWLDNLRSRFHAWQSRFLDHPKALGSLSAGLALIGLVCLVFAESLVVSMQPATNNWILTAWLYIPVALNFTNLSLILLLSGTGLCLILGAVWLRLGSRRSRQSPASAEANFALLSRGLSWSFTALVLQLTVLDLLLFYYLQFKTILLAVIQLFLLLAVIHYQRSA